MKDGNTRLTHKAEPAVYLDAGTVVAVPLQATELGDTTTIEETLSDADADTAVAELVERAIELHPGEGPQVNVERRGSRSAAICFDQVVSNLERFRKKRKGLAVGAA